MTVVATYPDSTKTSVEQRLRGRLGPTPRVGLELRELMLARRAEENLMETDHPRSPVARGTR
jgi:hypothetical protein